MKSFTLITGRSAAQGRTKEKGKKTREYIDNITVCEFDPKDLKALGIGPGENVRISTTHGNVVLKAVESKQIPHEGVIFIPYGAWANMLISPETDGTGMPLFKGIPAEVIPAPDSKVSEISLSKS